MIAKAHLKKGEKPLVSKKSLFVRMAKYKHIYIMLIPTILYFAIFCYGPMFGISIAFQDYSITKGVLKSPFVGFQNFIRFFSEYDSWRLIRNTLTISVYKLIFDFPAPIILALALNEIRRLKFKKAVQTITYMPHFISLVISMGMALTFLSSDGLFNGIRALFGQEPIQFMNDSKYFYPVYILTGIWQGIGWGSIIYMSALSGIDQELYEAATVDGAGRWKQMVHVTFPGILPTVVILLIMQIGTLMSVGYEKIILLYNPTIYDKADVISTYVYRKGLINGDYSYATAVSMFNSVVNIILLVFANKFSNKVVGSGLW